MHVVGRDFSGHGRKKSLSTRHKKTTRRLQKPPVVWNIQGMRGQVPPDCLLRSCQCLMIGVAIFIIGAFILLLGFIEDGVFEDQDNSTMARRAYYEDYRKAKIKFSKFTYSGPIIMGIGGFLILTTCVMAFEGRDNSSKVGPASMINTANGHSESYQQIIPSIVRGYNYTKRIQVRTVACQTNETLETPLIFDKRVFRDAFRKFSRTLRSASSKEEDLQRCPSAPNLLVEEELLNSSQQRNVSQRQAKRRSSYAPTSRIHSRRMTPAFLKHAVSVDYSVPHHSFPCRDLSPLSPNQERQHHSSDLNEFPCNPNHTRNIELRFGLGQTSGSHKELNQNANGKERLRQDNEPTCSKYQTGVEERDATGNAESSHNYKTMDLSTALSPAAVEVNLVGSSNKVIFDVLNTSGPSRKINQQAIGEKSVDKERHADKIGILKRDSTVVIQHHHHHYALRSHKTIESISRPTLTRQVTIDHPEMIYIPEPENQAILEEEDTASESEKIGNV